jgi:hypothetical protein
MRENHKKIAFEEEEDDLSFRVSVRVKEKQLLALGTRKGGEEDLSDVLKV